MRARPSDRATHEPSPEEGLGHSVGVPRAEETIVRLNARIANQREEINHKQFVLEQLTSRASQLCDLLNIDPAHPIALRLTLAIEAHKEDVR